MDKQLSIKEWESQARAQIAGWAQETGTELPPQIVDWFLLSRRARREEIKAAFLETLMQLEAEGFDGENPEHISILKASNCAKDAAEENCNIAQFLAVLLPIYQNAAVELFFKVLNPEILDEKNQIKGAVAASLVNAANHKAEPIPLQKLNKAWRPKRR